MSKKKRKVPIHMSLDEDEYEDYRLLLRGTRFEKNGEINASAAIRYYIQCVLEEGKKTLALGQPIQDRSAIKQLNTNKDTKQVTLDQVCPDWILDSSNKERRNKTLEGLELKDLRTLGISCKNTGTAILSTLPKLKVSQKDQPELGLLSKLQTHVEQGCVHCIELNLRKRLDLENIQTRTMDTTEEEDLEEAVEEVIL